MNSFTRFIHSIVIHSSAEEFLVRARNKFALSRKLLPVHWRNKFASIGRFIPNANEYLKNDAYDLTRDGTHFQINRSDYVQWRLFYGVRDNALIEAKKCIETGGVVLDIGASFGAFSLRLAKHAKNKSINLHVLAFEPNPVVVERYRSNLKLNPEIEHMIHVYPTGLGNGMNEQSFTYSESNTGAGRIVQAHTTGQLKITIQRLDDILETINPVKVSFVKLIAEGFEPEILKGGWKTIEKFKPPIFMEVTKKWWEENNSTVDNVLNQLRSLGYHFMIEHYNEMLPYEPEKYGWRTQFNLLATV